ncbi:uncharacterized protein LOC143244022 isoform X2 [Tachypleus tridentatus]|uniref:uncharacterized protein LOC143244022 isoform X2 n=1 Tax=Tachypleus tridentatus TaxID=6853 RepID=UPI003FD28582
MAACGCLEETSGVEEKAITNNESGFHVFGIHHKNDLLNENFSYGEEHQPCIIESEGEFAKCFRRLNGVNLNGRVQTSLDLSAEFNMLKNTINPLSLRSGGHQPDERVYSERRPRLDRSPSTDSVAVSSGASDSCQSSDTTSVSEPCSPECPASPDIPQPMPPLPASLSEETNDNCLLGSDDFDSVDYGVLPGRNCSKDDISEHSLEYQRDDLLQDGTSQPNGSLGFNEQDVKYEEDTGVQKIDFQELSREQNVTEKCSETDNISDDSINTFSALEVKEWEKSHVEKNLDVYSQASSSSQGLSTSSFSRQSLVSSSLCYNQSPTATLLTSSQSTASSKAGSLLTCKWLNCVTEVDCPSELVEHIRNVHVDSQKDGENFTCLWKSCKVYNRPSCSLSWLQRHMLTHGGNKPFKCIVDGCRQRFTSQSALERHVNSHFNSPPTSNASKSSRTKDDSHTKLVRRRKVRYRQRCYAVKTEDFFDAGIMEHIRHELMEVNAVTQVDLQGRPRTVTFHSIVQGRRVEESGKVTMLLHWLPEQIHCPRGLSSTPEHL